MHLIEDPEFVFGLGCQNPRAGWSGCCNNNVYSL